jgi:C-terminal processing protease CtpA/Prc
MYSARGVPPDPPADFDPTKTPPAVRKFFREEGLRTNFGFVKVEILDGNIGYVRFDGFFPAGDAGDTATAAMNFVAGTDALIFDLRANHGGDPTMVQLLLGYLFDEPVRFNDFVLRDTTKTQQYWSNAWVPGKRYLDKPVYVLTSKETFSCAEEFTYDLQTQKRSVTVGEGTGGGAHPVAPHRLTEHLAVMVPFARALNPITHTDWEGKGVQPDVPVAADKALAKATVLAVQRIAQHPRDPQHAEILKRVLKAAEAGLTK